MIKNYIVKRDFRKRLEQLRSYHQLLNSGEGERVIWQQLNDLFEHVPLASEKDFEAFMPDVFGIDAVNAIQQKIFHENTNGQIYSPLMSARSGSRQRYIVRIPKQWRMYLSEQSVRINVLSGLFWARDVLRHFRGGVVTYKVLKTGKFKRAPADPYAVFINLHRHAYHDTQKDDKKYDHFISWALKRFPFRKSWIVPIFSDGEKSGQAFDLVPEPFPAMEDTRIFQKKARTLILKAFLNMLIGRWHAAYMLKDLLEFYYIQALPDTSLAALYVFINSNYIYRPLWTYAAEQKGSQISLVFYATNTFNFEFQDGSCLGVAPGYKTMTWPHIHTKHENHIMFLKSICPYPSQYHAEDFVPYEDNGLPVSIESLKTVAFFDVQPFRDAYLAQLGRPCHVFNKYVSESILHDVIDTCAQQGLSLYLKPKRDVGRLISKSYVALIEQAERDGALHIVDSYIAARRLCAAVDAVICQPFTSVALCARELGKPVIYYDSQSIYKKEQLACQGIDMARGRDELELWLKGVFGETEAVA